MSTQKNKSNIIIINAFPSNNDKILLLGEQIGELKKLNKPILLVSGCEVPEFIQKNVDYLLVNTENDLLDKDWSYMLRKNGISEFGYDYTEMDNCLAQFFVPNVNQTITKNIKLGFNLAKALGYKNAFYTEDDNIWKSGSFEYINNNLSQLDDGKYLMGGILGEQIGSSEPMIFTTFFFANISYFIQRFITPHDINDWYDLENIKKFNLNKTYETMFYLLFKNDLNYFYNTEKEFNSILEPKSENILFGLNDRRHSEKNLFNMFFTVLPDTQNNKFLVVLNQSFYLKNGVKEYNCTIYYDEVFSINVKLDVNYYYKAPITNEIQKIRIEVDGYDDIIIDCNIDSVLNNGLIIPL